MGRHPLPLGRGRFLDAAAPTAVMGILNLTPDSFSDGGKLRSPDDVLRAAEEMIRAGADVLDLGGESTRPGAPEVPLQEEMDRVLPALEALARRIDVPLSIDTRRHEVFEAAWGLGASLLNDVSGATKDPAMLASVAATDAALILMHMRGEPVDMEQHATYDEVVEQVRAELHERVEAAVGAGIPRERLILDPGLGFAKRGSHSIELLRGLDRLRGESLPLLVGASRKRFLGELTGQPDPRRRDLATAVLSAHLCREGVEMVRVHDVAGTVEAIALTRGIYLEGPRRSAS